MEPPESTAAGSAHAQEVERTAGELQRLREELQEAHKRAELAEQNLLSLGSQLSRAQGRHLQALEDLVTATRVLKGRFMGPDVVRHGETDPFSFAIGFQQGVAEVPELLERLIRETNEG